MTEEEVRLLAMVDKVLGLQDEPIVLTAKGDCKEVPVRVLRLPKTGPLPKLAQTGPLSI